MQLFDLVDRALPPTPWAEGDNIPWHEPAFSARMLHEHLTQDHDAASRRTVIVDRHVAWIHNTLLGGRRSRILDLGCGPGLYTSRLARLGHQCVGLDYSPASIVHARAEAAADGLPCHYELADLRTAELGEGFDLAMQIFGELNVFPAEQAADLLKRARAALARGGALLIEAHTFAAVQQLGLQPPGWSVARAGLFSPAPHLRLSEHFWRAEEHVATIRHYVVDLASGGVTRYAQSMQAYTAEAYATLLRGCGFADVEFFPALTGGPHDEQPDMHVIVARA
jgi:SAM-dependent methyltransferase